MTTQTRVKKRQRKTGLLNPVLSLILVTLILLIFKETGSCTGTPAERGDVPGNQSSFNGYAAMDMDDADLATGSLVLVSRDHPYPFPDGLKLVSIYEHKNNDYLVRDKNVLVKKDIMECLNDMMTSFADETGLRDVNAVSGHRTSEFQQKLYDQSLETMGAEHTANYVALPGCSEHHTGLAVDFSIFHLKTGDSAEFDGSGGYGWFQDYAWTFGFTQRYQEIKSDITRVADEPWHFRYVGVPHAYYMKQNDLCLEEYVDLLRGYPHDGAHLIIDTGEQKFEVYFCDGMQVQVPEEGVYIISGNNVDGFIVTVSVL